MNRLALPVRVNALFCKALPCLILLAAHGSIVFAQETTSIDEADRVAQMLKTHGAFEHEFQCHRAIEGESRDEPWASTSESGLKRLLRIAEREESGAIARVECRKSACEVVVREPHYPTPGKERPAAWPAELGTDISRVAQEFRTSLGVVLVFGHGHAKPTEQFRVVSYFVFIRTISYPDLVNHIDSIDPRPGSIDRAREQARIPGKVCGQIGLR